MPNRADLLLYRRSISLTTSRLFPGISLFTAGMLDMVYCLREELVVTKEGVHINTERHSFIACLDRALES
jgi:hypothetical protein